jgi:ATP-dependent Lhr-like helicase
MDALSSFHPAIRTWFERRFPAGPTPPQQAGWPPIARGEDTLTAPVLEEELQRDVDTP